ncbi:GGDEF domain-containing protein [Limnoglobus roseus]|uniref:diguanylate cyclase n=1 Tax=Limnoglobus roseus TaxID=2598579 RepID=A0A5C1AEJ9_9BACT|nr:GGDEF domain-containing protein [Limnoglobus roseus]QEL15458.1 GGDEF domain-containing protein [Limnoglobus roseus]
MARATRVITAADLTRTEVSEQSMDRPSGHLVNASLIYIYPKSFQSGQRYVIGSTPVTLGRGSECKLSIPDTSVSRFHSRVEIGADGRHHVTDLGSTNGTFVNNTRTTEGPLADGDYLRVGNCIFRYLSGGNVEAEYHEEIYRLTVLDPLTGVFNRRYLMEILNREVARSVRYRRPLAVALFGIDFFKVVNDTHGHIAGDMTLRELAARVSGLIRTDEVFARYGGEEFAVVMTETARERAAAFGERIRAAVEAIPFTFEAQTYPVTVSVGIGTTDGAEPTTPEEILRRADELLYQAKRLGRNRVVV